MAASGQLPGSWARWPTGPALLPARSVRRGSRPARGPRRTERPRDWREAMLRPAFATGLSRVRPRAWSWPWCLPRGKVAPIGSQLSSAISATHLDRRRGHDGGPGRPRPRAARGSPASIARARPAASRTSCRDRKLVGGADPSSSPAEPARRRSPPRPRRPVRPSSESGSAAPAQTPALRSASPSATVTPSEHQPEPSTSPQPQPRATATATAPAPASSPSSAAGEEDGRGAGADRATADVIIGEPHADHGAARRGGSTP